jgi:hypothetical protein
MKSYILCRAHFSDAFVRQIQDAIGPGLHCILTQHSVNAATQPPNVLFVVAGSPANQKERRATVRFGGGSAAGAFSASLEELAAIGRKFV